ncbi:MAG: T9SS type A sorting domain-containing protein [Chitinophagaceae bacterium]|nr:T9SS type A sorting domain-containing protein [Chitinophagaceae bacterium]
MKNILCILTVLLLFFCSTNAQIIRPFTARYYNPSVKGNIVYVSNSIISTSGIGSGSPGTGEIPPAGSSRDNSGSGINIDVDNYSTVKLPFAGYWNYFATGLAPANDGGGSTWKQSAYTLTGSWNTGASPVNGPGKYGFNAIQATCIPSGGGGTVCIPTGTKYSAYYYRNTVSFTAAELATTFYSIQLNMLRDDGIVVYINGVERVRNNMPTGTIAYATLASANITPGAAEAVSVNLSPAFFSAGVNTIAVEVHLRTTSSTDMSFDMEVRGLSDNGTFNSSTSDLVIPTTCNQVLFAGLYWGADQGTNGTNTSWITGAYNAVQLKIPGSAVYQTVTSAQTDVHSAALSPGLPHTGYLCFADITSLVNTTNANGTYTVANVVGPIGIGNSCGGWTIVIVYSNASLLPRNLTVFDGSVIINQGDPAVDVNINGFLTPPSGPVSCELGSVVYDGDRVSTDSFSFKQNGAPAFYNLATTLVPFNNNNDAWNSKISYKNSIVTTRNPAFNNTLGYDASIFDLPNTANANLSNNQTAATVRFSSPGENYFVHVLTTSITQYNPAFAFDKTATDINGGLLLPGESLRYQVNYNNVGNDSSTSTVVYDNIPLGSTYLPGSLRINGVAKTDAAGDDEAEFDFTNSRVVLRIGLGANALTGGRIGPGIGGNIQFDVVTASSCDILSCTGSLRNEARISYNGKRSGNVLYDSSGVSTNGCIVKGPVISPVSGSCFSPKDTLLVVHCPVASVMLPWARYAGYTFYSAMPFIPANMYDPFIAVTSSGVYWAYFNSGAACSDTARVQVIITLCPDIDDDDDGIPDYVEFNNPLALQDANSNGIPNWNDAGFIGFVDYNGDNYNDNFDWGADSDNDGIPNFQDTGFWVAWVDINADGVNDNSDKDLDGLPNQYDRDSDNDGIPDVVESYGVDTNGDGIIDNFTETDYDGFSQNVDANNSGVNGSGTGLGAPDLDGDGIPNYLDTDSDNDGIPDVIEAAGTDSDNNGKPDGFVDANGNGLHDSYELAGGLLFTGVDISPVDGRADDYPFKNKDRDVRPNAYDLDSDGDGLVDVIEAGFTDANFNGIIDGAIGTNGWSTVISSLGSLGLRFTDTDLFPDYLDIDTDDDGIPDNIEGQTTAGYKLPGTVDNDGDGLVNTYDNFIGFGGAGIFVYDHDADGTPDYRDLDTDADGLIDRVEGNDFNLNEVADDDVTLTGLDTDGDGLDNRFDSLNSVINIKGTSYRMGNGGSFSGDAAPGSRTTVQSSTLSQTNRDWRFVGLVLPVQFLHFTASQNNDNVLLKWTIIAEKEVDRFEIERSLNGVDFIETGTVNGPVVLQVQQNFSATDNIANVSSNIIYYRLKVIGKAGEIKYSQVISIRKSTDNNEITILPNPANYYVVIRIYAEGAGETQIWLIDNAGKIILREKHKLVNGYNHIRLNQLERYSNGFYELKIEVKGSVASKKLIIHN